MRTYLDDINKLHALFDSNFMQAYRSSNPNKRRGVLPYLQSIYRRWYYSTLIEDAPLSPANLLEAICIHYEKPAATYPVAHARSKSKLTGIDIRLVEYSLDSHPIVDDMRLLIDYCTPYVDLQDGAAFVSSQALELAEQISLNDPMYAAFLLEVSLGMKLIVKVPSVGVSRYKPALRAGEVMAAPCRDLLRDIVETTLTMASKGLQNLVMLPESLFTTTFLRSLLEKPMLTDDIFAMVYDSLGYDLDDVMEATMEEGGLDGLDVDILAGTFMTGVLMDKFFFTPFGHFMKLIRPLYILPFEFGSEITDYIDVLDDPEEGTIAFFAPCSSYTLTDLGLECMGVAKTEDNYQDAPAAAPFEMMMDTVFKSTESLSVFAEVARHLGPMRMEKPPEDIYTFRARLESNTAVWAHVQMPSDATLHDMYIEIAGCLGLKENDDYAFYHDKTENPFAEYASDRRAKRGRKTSFAELDDLDFEHQKQMLLVAYNQALPFGDDAPIVRIQLEFLHANPPDVGHEYPRISRISKGLRESFEE
ncbi:MAG: hypothetical protein FWC92_06760 [Defluviitaleaceae bacterium]|nr:hypothetical protein [Defluviitaleaceae bacterium]